MQGLGAATSNLTRADLRRRQCRDIGSRAARSSLGVQTGAASQMNGADIWQLFQNLNAGEEQTGHSGKRSRRWGSAGEQFLLDASASQDHATHTSHTRTIEAG
eukprot:GHVU01183635.1.p2 GENE.GHVU01183635.1~~GHVU01183635.1.p2  ORF type:complete len:103 (-),score=6.01 GHVU01183635.1:114-422(-)